jgi:hypothetical protein
MVDKEATSVQILAFRGFWWNGPVLRQFWNVREMPERHRLVLLTVANPNHLFARTLPVQTKAFTVKAFWNLA